MMQPPNPVPPRPPGRKVNATTIMAAILALVALGAAGLFVQERMRFARQLDRAREEGAAAQAELDKVRFDAKGSATRRTSEIRARANKHRAAPHNNLRFALTAAHRPAPSSNARTGKATLKSTLPRAVRAPANDRSVRTWGADCSAGDAVTLTAAQWAESLQVDRFDLPESVTAYSERVDLNLKAATSDLEHHIE